MISEGSAERFAAAITWTIAVLFFTTALVIAYVIPLHAQDALTFGEWSRLIAQDWHFHYAAATVQEYGRPLFYVLQGGLWGAIGVDDSSGRILSLLFSLLLFGSLVWLVREERDWGILAGLLAMLALLATPVFAFQMVAGLTDVPVAAFIALAGALVWGRRPTPARAAAAAVAAALAMLTKPSALLALVGLALAQLLVDESWRSRILYRIMPLAAGLAAALAYDLTQARYVHQGLRTFLQAGVNTDYYRALADEARRYAIFDGNWFGDGLRVAAFFALLYALLRLTGIRPPHRGARRRSLCVARELARAVVRGTPGSIRCWRAPFAGCGGGCTRDGLLPHARPPHGPDGDSVSRRARALRHLGGPDGGGLGRLRRL